MDDATERRTWTLILSVNAFYGGFFVLYVTSSLLLFQRRRHLETQARYGFGGDRERLRTMRFWEITGAIMFVVLTAVSCAFQCLRIFREVEAVGSIGC